MIRPSPRYALLAALVFSAAMLIGAWIFQYGFGYAPCTMCYWQRHMHKLVIFVAALGLGATEFGRMSPRLWIGLTALALFGAAAMAFSHMGVEFGWWEGPQACSADGNMTLPELNPNDPLAIFETGKIKPPACSDVVWRFVGLSMASWNALLSLAAAGFIAILGAKGQTHAQS